MRLERQQQSPMRCYHLNSIRKKIKRVNIQPVGDGAHLKSQPSGRQRSAGRAPISKPRLESKTILILEPTCKLIYSRAGNICAIMRYIFMTEGMDFYGEINEDYSP